MCDGYEVTDQKLAVIGGARATTLGVVLADHPVKAFALTSKGLVLSVGAERPTFDAVYPALGSTVHSELAAGLGAALTDEG